MSTMATLRAADGMTVGDLAGRMRAKMEGLADDCMLAAGTHARTIVAVEGAHHYVRARKTRRVIRLGAKLGPHSHKQAIVYGIPAGFWAIVEQGSTRTWRIERKLLGRGRNRRAQLISTPYGPRPYVIRHGMKPSGHPWALAMIKVQRIPQSVFEPSTTKAFAAIWKG
jgi:hypothetical protein